MIRRTHPRQTRPYIYRGCRITIAVAGPYSHRYEWMIEPLRPDLVKRCRGQKYICDPTSHKFLQMAKLYAKDAVDGILRSNLSWPY